MPGRYSLPESADIDRDVIAAAGVLHVRGPDVLGGFAGKPLRGMLDFAREHDVTVPMNLLSTADPVAGTGSAYCCLANQAGQLLKMTQAQGRRAFSSRILCPSAYLFDRLCSIASVRSPLFDRLPQHSTGDDLGDLDDRKYHGRHLRG